MQILYKSLLVLGVVVATGCADGPQTFRGTTPIQIAGQPPRAETKPPRVEVKDNRIVIHEKIQFEYDKADIREESYDLLQEIADTIKANPHIKKIRIEGHASAEGADAYNLKLSKARAKSVMDHLVEKGGIEDAKLVSEGYGETRPIADNETDEGREANRRVEFIITDQEVTTVKYEVDPDTGKRRKVAEKTKEVTVKRPPTPDTAEKPETATDANQGKAAKPQAKQEAAAESTDDETTEEE